MMGVFTVSKRGTWGKPWETFPLRDLRGSKGILSKGHDKVVMKKQKSADLSNVCYDSFTYVYNVISSYSRPREPGSLCLDLKIKAV